MCTISVREDMGTGEITHLLAYTLLLQKAWARFLAPTRGDSQLPVPPAPEDLISSSGLGGHPHNTYKQITYTQYNFLKRRENTD